MLPNLRCIYSHKWARYQSLILLINISIAIFIYLWVDQANQAQADLVRPTYKICTDEQTINQTCNHTASMQSGSPDLQTRFESIRNTAPYCSPGILLVNFRVRNYGTASAAPSTAAIYIAGISNSLAMDPILTEYVSIPALASQEETGDLTVAVQVTEFLIPETFYAVFEADVENIIDEGDTANESNNKDSVPFIVSACPPEQIAANWELYIQSDKLNDSIQLSWFESPQGTNCDVYLHESPAPYANFAESLTPVVETGTLFLSERKQQASYFYKLTKACHGGYFFKSKTVGHFSVELNGS